MALTKVTYSMIQGAPVNVFDYMTEAQIASITSGVGTAAGITEAIEACFADHDNVYFPEGTYWIKGISFDGGFPDYPSGIKISGAGRHKTIFRVYPSGSGGRGYGFKFFGLSRSAPVGFNQTLDDIDLSGFGVLGDSYLTVGIDINAGYRCNLDDLYLISHKYGVSLKNSIMINFTGISEFAGNHVGVKTHARNITANIDTYVLFGATVVSFEQLNTRVSVKAGVSFSDSSAISILLWLSESTPIVMYLLQNVDSFSCSNLYYEPNASITPSALNYARQDREGNYQFWTVYMGSDEDNTVGLGVEILQIVFNTITEYGGTLFFRAFFCQGLFYNCRLGRGYVQIDGDCEAIQPPTRAANWDAGNTIRIEDGSTFTKINGYRRNPYNLFPNGNFTLPSLLTPVTTTNCSVDIVSSESIGVVSPYQKNMMRITLTAGSANAVVNWIIGAASRYSNTAKNGAGVFPAWIEAHIKASSANVSLIGVRALNSNGNNQGVTTNAAYGRDADEWNVIVQSGNVNYDNAALPFFYVQLEITRSSFAGTDYVYVDELIVRDINAKEIDPVSTFDIDSGLCYSGTTSTGAGPRYYAEFTLPAGLRQTQSYDVVATGYGSADLAISVEKAVGSFRVWSNSNTGSVVAKVVPRIAYLP
jgi:hypothetical protein